MTVLPNMRDSQSSPLQIAEILFGEHMGRLGLSICPGKKNQPYGWNRNLEEDLHVIRNWGASMVVTLIETQEFEFLEVMHLGESVQKFGMRWTHLPIHEMDAPDTCFEEDWVSAGPEIDRRIHSGENVLIHCRGGLGRSGLVAAMILIERGCTPNDAIHRIREVRPGAIQTAVQEQYIFRFGQERSKRGPYLEYKRP